MVDLWSALPPLSATRLPEPARDVPVRQSEPRPAPKPAPVPKLVQDELPPQKAPDIALEKKKLEAERLKKLKAMQAIEEQERADAARKEAEAIKQARDKQQAEQKKREALRQIEADELAQQMAEENAATAARAAAGKRQAEMARTVGLHRDLISAKVRSNTRLPDNLKGNPQVRCLVKLLPPADL